MVHDFAWAADKKIMRIEAKAKMMLTYTFIKNEPKRLKIGRNWSR
jgi:hypothetical protein